MAQLTIFIGVTFHTVTLITDFFLTARQNIAIYLTWFHIAGIFLGLFYGLAKKIKFFPTKIGVIFAQFWTIAGYAYLLFWVSKLDPVIAITHMKVWTAFVVMGIFSTVLCPLHNYGSLIYVLGCLPMSYYACSAIPGGQGMVYVSSLSFIGALIFQRASVFKSYEDARREYANRLAIAAAQRESYEQQLIIARRIHDSFTAPAEYSRPGLNAKFFQHRSEAVGGDWMAMRVDSKGRLVIVVADASGKGVQAALVTHAIQAIWADSLADVSFEPERWLSKVNKTLKVMGRKYVHSATIAIMAIDHRQLEYWSAGHVPGYLILGPDERDIKPLTARGPLLGVTEGEDFLSVIHEFSDQPFDVILGTDGVFEKGTYSSPRNISELYRNVLANPHFLADASFAGDDDRSMVIIRVDNRSSDAKKA